MAYLFYHMNCRKKINKVIVLLNVVFWGILIESFIIYKTGAEYKTRGDNMNISLWLINCYMIFAINIVYLYDIVPQVIKQQS